MLTSSEANVTDVKVLSPLGRADHSVITWNNYLVRCERICEREVYRYDYRNADYEMMRQLMGEFDWTPVSVANNVNQAWDFSMISYRVLSMNVYPRLGYQITVNLIHHGLM